MQLKLKRQPPHTPQTPSSQTPMSSISSQHHAGFSEKKPPVETATKTGKPLTQTTNLSQLQKQKKKELISNLEEQSKVSAQLQQQLVIQQREHSKIQQEHAAASSIIGRQERELAHIRERAETSAIEISRLQKENNDLGSPVLATDQVEDQVTEDEIRRKMRELVSSITRWVRNHLKEAQLGT